MRFESAPRAMDGDILRRRGGACSVKLLQFRLSRRITAQTTLDGIELAARNRNVRVRVGSAGVHAVPDAARNWRRWAPG
jgi:hypothetical protein